MSARLNIYRLFADKDAMPIRAQIIIFVALFLSTLSTRAGASSACKEIRLDAPGRSMSHIPVMDQDGKPICYAYTASQMVDAWRFSHGDTNYAHITSPVTTAVFYASNDGDRPNRKDIEGGWSDHAIQAIARHGSCDHRLIHNRFGQTGLREYFKELKSYFDALQFLDFRRNYAELTESVQCTLRRGGPDAVIPTISEILNALSQPTRLKYLEELFRSVCKNPVRIDSLPEPKEVWAEDLPRKDRHAQLIKQINDQFNKPNPQPFGMDFCIDILWKKNMVGVNSEGNDIDRKSCSGYHSSLIIGQRPTTSGKCEFLVRNSHGQSCNAYGTRKCKDGQIWVGADELAQNIVHLSWMEEK